MAYDPTKVTLGADLPTTPTASDRDPWQEALTKFRSVPASKVLEAADVIRGLNGSWAAHYVLEPGYRDSEGIHSEDNQEPATRAIKSSRLGQPGVAEINFDPYNYRTNRFAHKGGSLLGHPISFSVVGPTLKRDGVKWVNWQWQVTDNSGTPNGDELSLDEFILDPVTLGVIARTNGLTQRYGISDLADYNGGLYIIISQTGSPGEIINPATGVVTDGSTGDGFVFQVGGPVGRYGIYPTTSSSKYEIFRVVGLATRLIGPEPDTLILDSGKRLADYFTFNAGKLNAVRAISIIKPEATRLLAVPDSGTQGKEQVFVAVPPNRALRSDQQYPRTTDAAQPTQPDGWIGAAFEEPLFPSLTADGSQDPYSEYEWELPPHTPIPRATGEGVGRLYGEWTAMGVEAIVDYGPGRMAIGSVSGTEPDTGQVIYIHDIKTRGTPRLNGVASTWAEKEIPEFDSLLGWYEVVRQLSDGVLVRRISELEPTQGHSYFGVSSIFALNPAPAPVEGDRVELHYTIHNQINQLWRTNHFDIDQVESARLTNLVNPDWADRLIKDQPITPARADRAIFDTSTSDDGADGSNSNPGSLLDLGFRVVLFPATVMDIDVPDPDDSIHWNPAAPTWGRTQTVTRVVPDFDRPVMAHEAVLDTSSSARTEKQYVEVDYSNGLVRLSHAPTVGSDLYPSTNLVFTADDNPRGELVIFAACVPYSMEAGQLGSAIRATASPPTDNICTEDTVESLDQHDVFGSRVWFPLADQTVTSTPGDIAVVPAIILTPNVVDQIPQCGFVDILEVDALDYTVGDDAGNILGDPAFTTDNSRGATFGYYGTLWDPTGAILGQAGTGLLFPYGGGVHGQTITVDNTTNPAIAVLRRDVTTPNDTEAVVGTPYQDDTTYGDSWRANTLRFENADVKANADGSTTVRTREILAERNQQTLGDLYTSWILEGGAVSTSVVAGPSVEVTQPDAVIMSNGRRILVPRQVLDIGGVDGVYYIFLQSNDCWVLNDYPTLPLADPDDILLAMVELDGFPGAPSVTVTDLRYLMNDVDRRWDVTVGKLGATEPKWASYAPHFETLAEAVEYVNNLMRPASGTADRHFKIRIVGPTDENAADLPIHFRTDGVIVEGAARLADYNTTGDPVEIRWDSDNALIDFNNSSGLVFRNITFSYTGSDPNPVTPTRYVFTQGGEGVSYNIVIDNCILVGDAQGLLAVGASVGLDNSILGLRMTGCNVWDALDFGVYQHPNNISIGWTIRDNYFQSSGNGSMTDVAAVTLVGNYHRVDNNFVSGPSAGNAGFEKGVLFWDTNADEISFNAIRDTYEEGIVVEDGNAIIISGNDVRDVFHLAPSVGAVKAGIWVKEGERHEIRSNFVCIESSSAGDLAIHLEGTGSGHVVDTNDVSECTQGVIQVDAQESQVLGNKCKELNLGAGYIRVEANQVTTACRLSGDNCSVVGNRMASLEAGYDVTNDTLGQSADHVISGNVLADLYLGTGCSVASNDIGNLYVDSGCRIIGNEITWLKEYVDGPSPSTHATHVASNVVIANNTVDKVGENGAGAEDYIMEGLHQAIIEGNIIDTSLALREAATTTVDNLRVVGNRITGELNFGTAGQPIDDSTIMGNYVSGTVFSVYGARCEVANNNFAIAAAGAATPIIGDNTRVIGNRTVNNILQVSGARCVVADNVVTGASCYIDIPDAASLCTISANTVEGKIEVDADDCTIDGNVVGTDINILSDATDCTVSGNRAGGDININATGCSVTGNRVTDDIIVLAGLTDAVIVGNTCDTIAMTAGGAGNNIAVANRVYGNSVFGGAGAGPVVENNFA